MDVQMPGMSGFDATAAIRRQEESTGRHVPIIAMTAHAMEGDRDRCLAAGMDDYVPKPISLEALRRALASVASDNGRRLVEREPLEREVRHNLRGGSGLVQGMEVQAGRPLP